jgi:hypothetical protein
MRDRFIDRHRSAAQGVEQAAQSVIHRDVVL